MPFIGDVESTYKEIREWQINLRLDKERVIPINHHVKNFERAFDVIGIKFTPHYGRHLFITRSLQAGVDVATVAKWVGHKDGGALLLKSYSHLIDSHSREMAKKVRI